MASGDAGGDAPVRHASRAWIGWSEHDPVNQRYADAVVHLTAPGTLVWIHAYPLQLVPDLIRRQRHDLRIGFFLHILFPAPDTFRQLPGRDEVCAAASAPTSSDSSTPGRR